MGADPGDPDRVVQMRPWYFGASCEWMGLICSLPVLPGLPCSYSFIALDFCTSGDIAINVIYFFSDLGAMSAAVPVRPARPESIRIGLERALLQNL